MTDVASGQLAYTAKLSLTGVCVWLKMQYILHMLTLYKHHGERKIAIRDNQKLGKESAILQRLCDGDPPSLVH